MNIKPILFSTPMVKAIMGRTKTKTRRIIKDQPITDPDSGYVFTKNSQFDIHNWKEQLIDKYCPYPVGTILWVRETWLRLVNEHIITTPFVYRANSDPDTEEIRKEYIKSGYPYNWKPSIFMRKEVARIFLEVVNVEVEQLQDISEGDAIAEGIKRYTDPTLNVRYCDYMANASGYGDPDFDFPTVANPVDSFKSLWNSINGKKCPWDSNPWVWVYELKEVSKPEGF